MNSRQATVFITKPKVSIDNWRDLFSLIEQSEFKIKDDEDLMIAGGWHRFLHPSDTSPTGFDEAFDVALTKARSGRGLVCRLDPVERAFKTRLDQHLNMAADLRTYGYITEFGALFLLTIISDTDDNPSDTQPTPMQLRTAFADTIVPELAESIQREVASFVNKVLGLDVSPNFTESYSYQVSFFDADAGPLSEEMKSQHRLEDGAADNIAEKLLLSGIGCDEAVIGWGTSTISSRADWAYVFLIPVFVSIDALYSVTTLLVDDASDEFVVVPNKVKIGDISDMVERQERLLARAERLMLFHQSYMGRFKPWQASIYKELYERWDMGSMIDLFRKAMSLRLNELRTAQTTARLRMEERRNGLLMFIAAFEIIGLLGALVSYLDLRQRLADGQIEHPIVTYIVAYSVPGVIGLVVLSLVLYFLWRR